MEDFLVGRRRWDVPESEFGVVVDIAFEGNITLHRRGGIMKLILDQIVFCGLRRWARMKEGML